MSLDDVADKAYRKMLLKSWSPTRREFESKLKLSEHQGMLVWRTVKDLAADNGHVAGYHPKINRRLIVTKGNIKDCKAIVDYAGDCASRQLGGLRAQTRGASKGRYVTKESAAVAIASIDAARNSLRGVGDVLEWNESSNGPKDVPVSKMSRDDLRKEAKDWGATGYGRMSKSELVKLVRKLRSIYGE